MSLGTVREVATVDSIKNSVPTGQMCGCCGVVNSNDVLNCAWCGSRLADASPPPKPLVKRVGPEPEK
jgi:hypothetical protein